MPTLTRWFIKSALLYLMAALLLGALLALRSLLNLPPFLLLLNPAYFHLFMVGWVTQMIFGVIYWMFPIITRARPRGSEPLGWATYVLLNSGLLLRVVAEPWAGLQPGSAAGWLLVLSAVLQWLAAVCFIVNAWPRVKEKYRGG
jgi:cbb3-type cytochrome oxidase subunit 1